MDKVAIGKRMQKVRKAAGMTGDQFGGQLDPPVGKAAVSAWEKGRNDPPSSAILLLAERGRVTTDFILRGLSPEELNPLEAQMLFFFRNIRASMRDTLLQTANEFYNSTHPGKSPANPFGGRRTPVE